MARRAQESSPPPAVSALAALAALALVACSDADLPGFTTGATCGDAPVPACEDNGGCAGGESGRMQGMIAAHDAVRAAVERPAPDAALPPMRWSDDLAAVARNWARELVRRGCRLEHSRSCRYGENLAWYSGYSPTAEEVVVEGWASEEACYSYGRFLTTDGCTPACDDSGGCGHYTQIIWAATRDVGCAVESCGDGSEVWVCNYAPVGNVVGELPY
jgi:pathogenesis-related protein 1